jgi:acyl-coenzyme A thioesterase PaaI-like protein
MSDTVKPRRVVRKQANSAHCFVCGLKNVAGLQASFFETDDDRLAGVFKPREEFQSYPGRLHGGLAATILDETMGRCISLGRGDDQVWGVTVNLSLNYRKPVPLDADILAVAWKTKEGGRVCETAGEIRLATGEVAVEATGRYMKLPIERIVAGETDALEWGVVARPDDPAAVSLADPSIAPVPDVPGT